MDTREGGSDPGLRRQGNNSGRIPIHSLLAPTSEETGGSSSEPRPSISTQPSSSQSSTGTPASFTPLNSTYDRHSARRTSAPPTSPSSNPPPTPGSQAGSDQDDVRSSHHNLAAADMQGRQPRAPRPSYSEEQKFFIMYARVMKDQTWPEIEDQFNVIFGTRTKGGLTSVYYRVRKDWGLMEVLKSGPDSFTADCKEVERRARNFSAEFLAQIGYLLDR